MQAIVFGMTSDTPQISAIKARLAEAGISPDQITLALETSSTLRAVLARTDHGDDGGAMRTLYAEFAARAAPDDGGAA